jgi:hypothetical protein
VRWIGFSEKCQSASGSALIDLQDGKLTFPQTVQDSSMASTLTLTGPSAQFDATDGHRSEPVSLRQRHGLIVKGKRISCPPHPDYEHGFPLIRSLRASAQRSTISIIFIFR